MPPFDVAALAPISPDAPAGDNLELDPEFGALERAAQGKPEVQYGSTIEAAVPPDWKEAAGLAQALLGRTHDLRILIHLAIARLHTDGISGLAETVALIRVELESEWAHLHPQLDPEDDNDPMQRANALALLRDPGRVLRPLRDAPLAGNRTGRLVWRDIAVMNGVIEPEPGRDRMSEANVLGLFRDTDPARFPDQAPALERLLADVPALVAAFDAQAGSPAAPDLSPLTKLLADIQRDVLRFKAATAEAGPAEVDDRPADAAGSPAPASRAVASIGQITALTRREDALHALELAASYFRREEPSSPLPLLIDRAKRLAGMDFMAIVRDMASDGLRQAQLVAGDES